MITLTWNAPKSEAIAPAAARAIIATVFNTDNICGHAARMMQQSVLQKALLSRLLRTGLTLRERSHGIDIMRGADLIATCTITEGAPE